MVGIKLKEFQEKCRGICNNNERWKKRKFYCKLLREVEKQ